LARNRLCLKTAVFQTYRNRLKLREYAGSISASDLKMMKDAINKDCEQVDLDEW